VQGEAQVKGRSFPKFLKQTPFSWIPLDSSCARGGPSHLDPGVLHCSCVYESSGAGPSDPPPPPPGPLHGHSVTVSVSLPYLYEFAKKLSPVTSPPPPSLPPSLPLSLFLLSLFLALTLTDRVTVSHDLSLISHAHPLTLSL
jgi:hypothetical protein